MDAMKIRDVASTYGITARTLRYYEDAGLLTSLRGGDCAYRQYDRNAIKRLEQILILRKLDISVKDITRIFAAGNLDILLDILHRKMEHMDDEMQLLKELKAVIHTFVQEIRGVDFLREQDVRQLYLRTIELENRLSHSETVPSEGVPSETVPSEGVPSETVAKEVSAPVATSPVEHMMDLTDRLEKLPDVRMLSLPSCRMASSGLDAGPMMEPGGRLERFSQWFDEADRQRSDHFFSRDFMWYDAETQGTVWWYAVEPHITVPDEFETVDFAGGFYASAVSRDEDDSDGQRVYKGIKRWVEHGGVFEIDESTSRHTMFHIIGTPHIKELMGYAQLEIYVPVRAKAQSSPA